HAPQDRRRDPRRAHVENVDRDQRHHERGEQRHHQRGLSQGEPRGRERDHARHGVEVALVGGPEAVHEMLAERLRQEDLAVLGDQLEAVNDPALRSEWRTYLSYHARRYEVLLRVVLRLLAGKDAPRILNVGPMFETALLRERVPGAVVDTLGFAPSLFPPGPGERHLEVDLNGSGETSAPAGDGSY